MPINPYSSTLSKRLNPDAIRQARVLRGLTQQQLAAMLDCHEMTISRWERGTRAPTTFRKKQLVKFIEGTNALAHKHGEGKQG